MATWWGRFPGMVIAEASASRIARPLHSGQAGLIAVGWAHGTLSFGDVPTRSRRRGTHQRRQGFRAVVSGGAGTCKQSHGALQRRAAVVVCQRHI